MPLEWSALWNAMDAAPAEWIPTTPAMHDEMLGAVPPRAMARGAFLVGEPARHDSDGRAVYACFRRIGDSFAARYMTHAEFSEWSRA